MGTHYKGKPREVRALDAFIKLMRAANALRTRLDKALAEVGLTEVQFGVLEALHHLGPLGPSELGRKMLVSGANMTSVLDRLEDRGLVRRHRETDDRRCLRIHLTDEGRAFVKQVFPQHLERIVAAFAVLSAGEQEELARLCRTLGTASPR